MVKDMKAEISQLEGRRAKMGELKQGMMQELLTGRIRLTLSHEDAELNLIVNERLNDGQSLIRVSLEEL